MDRHALVDLVRRGPALTALRDRGPMDRHELQEHLDVSRPTVHRVTRALEDRKLVVRTDEGCSLTALGETITAALDEFEHATETAERLAPVLGAVVGQDPPFDPVAFADATITLAEPGNPYRPVERFMELMEVSKTLRGLDPAPINPLHVEEVYTRVRDGMDTDAVFSPEAIRSLLTTHPNRMATVFESGHLTLRTHSNLPFGLTLCDDRVGVGIYGNDAGLLRTYIDTDAPAAREWAKDIYMDYRAEATELTEHSVFSENPIITQFCTLSE